MKRGNWIVKIVGLVLVAIAALGFVTMSLWNWLIPALFHGPVITFWQALGLLVLSKILFWSFAKRPHGSGHWRPYWKAKWNTMTPEERDRFKQKMKEKWCGWDEGNSGQKPNEG